VSERAIVFDCDGVLVDSEGLAWQAWREVLELHGYEVEETDVDALLGRSAEEILEYFSRRACISDGAEMKDALESTMMALLDDHLVCFEDAVSLAVEGRARGLRIAVASSSDRRRVLRSLSIVGIPDLFDVIVAGDDVPNGKPSPDVYLEAARRLRISPRKCLAVEDSPVGVAAALAAGMFVVAVMRAGAAREDLGAASMIVESLSLDVLDIGFMAEAQGGAPPAEVT
jgi:beta-phosphoglucomutase-like phosphatase (HAD superfamily)